MQKKALCSQDFFFFSVLTAACTSSLVYKVTLNGAESEMGHMEQDTIMVELGT